MEQGDKLKAEVLDTILKRLYKYTESTLNCDTKRDNSLTCIDYLVATTSKTSRCSSSYLYHEKNYCRNMPFLPENHANMDAQTYS